MLTGPSPSFSTLLTSATQGSCVPIYGRWGTPARLLASLPPLRIVPLRISAKPYDPTGNGNPGSRFPLLKPKEKKNTSLKRQNDRTSLYGAPKMEIRRANGLSGQIELLPYQVRERERR